MNSGGDSLAIRAHHRDGDRLQNDGRWRCERYGDVVLFEGWNRLTLAMIKSL